jgi:hypothetical protein
MRETPPCMKQVKQAWWIRCRHTCSTWIKGPTTAQTDSKSYVHSDPTQGPTSTLQAKGEG